MKLLPAECQHLQDKVAIVTGASRGIGKAIALELASQGATVVVNYAKSSSAADAVVEEITAAGGKAIALQADVAKSEEVDNLVDSTKQKFGHIDVLVNNAGIARDTLMLRMKLEDWQAVIDLNLTGVFLCTRAVSKLMLKQKSGRIINITSVSGLMGNPGQSNYSAAKAGVIGLTKTLAKEFASRGVTVNAVAPGFIATAMTDVLTDKQKEAILTRVPAGRLGSGEDVAAAVLYLSSEEAGYVTGQTLHVNGGMAMI